MNGSMLCGALHELLPADRIRKLAAKHKVVERERKLDVVGLVRALVLSGGNGDDSGRQADVYSTYLLEGGPAVVRGSFYGWFTEELACLMADLFQDALALVRKEPRILPKLPIKMLDWLVVDSETVTLSKRLAEQLPGTSDRGAIKIHKVYSLGVNNTVAAWTSPAKEHDGPHLRVGKWMENKVLIVDLGYASFDLIAQCREYGVGLVMRLKDGWKPRLERLEVDGVEMPADEGMILEGLTESELRDFGGSTIDADVVFGQGTRKVRARLVGVPGDKGYHWTVTLLPRGHCPASVVGMLYRTRWGIERSNREDKGGCRLDQIRATTVPSVQILIHAALLRSVLCSLLVHRDTSCRPATRAPLHAFALALAVAEKATQLLDAFSRDDASRWDRLADCLRRRGMDPNWRRRPSQWDQLISIVAPPGRPRRSRQADCDPSSCSYRQAA